MVDAQVTVRYDLTGMISKALHMARLQDLSVVQDDLPRTCRRDVSTAACHAAVPKAAALLLGGAPPRPPVLITSRKADVTVANLEFRFAPGAFCLASPSHQALTTWRRSQNKSSMHSGTACGEA